MTESALVLALSLVCAMVGLAIWKTLSTKPSRNTRVNLLSTCLRSLHHLQLRSVAIALPLLALLLFVGFAIVRSHRDADPCPTTWSLGSWLTVSFLLGACGTILQQHIVALLATRLTLPGVARLTSHSSADSKSIALRQSLLAPLFSTSLALALPLAAHIVASHLLHASLPSADAALLRSPFLLAGYLLGTTITALVFVVQSGLARSTPRSASCVASDSFASPLAAAFVVGRVAVPHSTIAINAFGTTTIAVCAALLHGADLAQANRQSLPFVASAFAFPCTVLAFGLAASLVGVLAVRRVDSDAAHTAFDRGLLVTLALSVAATAGAARWLFDAQWLAPFASASLASCSVFGFALLRRKLARTSSSHAPKSLSHSALPLSLSLSRGTRQAALSLGVAFFLLALGAVLGRVTGLQHGVTFGITCVLAGVCAPGLYVLTHAAAASLRSTSLCVETFCTDKPLADTASEDEHELPTYMSSYLWLTSLLASVVLALCVDPIARVFQIKQAALFSDLFAHMPWAFALLSLTGCAAFVALLWRSFTNSLATIGIETERALGDHANDDEHGASSTEAPPEHRAWFDLVSVQSVRASAAPLLTGLVLATAVAVVYRFVAGAGGEGVTASPLIATVVGMALLSSGFDAISAEWLGHRVADKTEPTFRKSAVDAPPNSANNHPNGAADSSDTVDDMFRHLTIPALHAMMMVLVAVTVVLSPLFQ